MCNAKPKKGWEIDNIRFCIFREEAVRRGNAQIDTLKQVYSNVFPNIEDIINSHQEGIYTANYCDKPDNVGHEQILQRHLENNNIKFELRNFKNYLFRDKDKRTRIHSVEG